jgi:predicted GH43/DUF377 family glycosyl hydrolase
MDHCMATKGFEKNWLPFFVNNSLHFVYQGSPHIVFRCDSEFNAVDQYYWEWEHKHWIWGEIRGGTPPVMGPDGLLWTAFHSSQPWRNGKRRYYAGWYAFEPTPPFRVVSVSRQPFLVGSTKDGCPVGKLPCVFPAGCIYREGEFIVSMGVNDLKTAIARIPFDWVKGSVQEIVSRRPAPTPSSVIERPPREF